jgi:hypothetical protein
VVMMQCVCGDGSVCAVIVRCAVLVVIGAVCVKCILTEVNLSSRIYFYFYA